LKYSIVKIRSKKEPEESIRIRTGLGFQALCAAHETPIEFDCREADCGICIVTVTKGMENLSPPTPSEKDFLKAMNADERERLACQCRINGDVSVEVEY
jgi:ferredoxin